MTYSSRLRIWTDTVTALLGLWTKLGVLLLFLIAGGLIVAIVATDVFSGTPMVTQLGVGQALIKQGYSVQSLTERFRDALELAATKTVSLGASGECLPSFQATAARPEAMPTIHLDSGFGPRFTKPTFSPILPHDFVVLSGAGLSFQSAVDDIHQAVSGATTISGDLALADDRLLFVARVDDKAVITARRSFSTGHLDDSIGEVFDDSAGAVLAQFAPAAAALYDCNRGGEALNQAEEIALDVSKRQPSQVAWSLTMLGIIAQGRSDNVAAVAYFRRVAALEPGDRTALENLANATAAEGNVDEATAKYKQAIGMGSDAAAVDLGNLLCLHARPGSPAMREGLKYLESAAKNEPSSSEAQVSFAQALEGDGKPALATNVFEEALAAQPGNREILAAWALFDLRSAEQRLQESHPAAGTDSTSSRRTLDSVRERLTEVVASLPRWPVANAALGSTWLLEARLGFSRVPTSLPNAQHYLEAAISLAPEWGMPEYDVAQVYFAQGRYKDSAAAFSNAAELDPTLTWAYCGLAQAYDRLKDRRKKADALKRCPSSAGLVQRTQ